VPFLHTGGADLASFDFVYTIYRLQWFESFKSEVVSSAASGHSQLNVHCITFRSRAIVACSPDHPTFFLYNMKL
jgi:hypothetical protein